MKKDFGVQMQVRPLYQKIIEDIKSKIANGSYITGQKIPGEIALMEEYNVSRITVRRAISALSDDGYLVKKQGLGTFVEKPRIRRKVSSILSFSQSCADLKMTPSYIQRKLILVKPLLDEAKFLSLGKNDLLIYSKRILCADHLPIMLENCFFPNQKEFEWILHTSLEQPLYPLLEAHGQLPKLTEKRTLEIALADDKIAAMLKMPEGGALFYKTAYLCDENKRPLFIERSYIVGNRYIFDITNA